MVFANTIDETKLTGSSERIRDTANKVIDSVQDSPGQIAKRLGAGLCSGVGGTGLLSAAVGLGLCIFLAVGGLLGIGPLLTLFVLTVSSLALLALGDMLQGA